MRDHREYAVFKNGGLVAWGLGMPSKALLAHPEETFEFVAGTSTSARTRSEALVTHEAKLH